MQARVGAALPRTRRGAPTQVAVQSTPSALWGSQAGETPALHPRRPAARRFGASAKPLYPLLDEVHSTTKLAEIGEWLVVDTIDQLIAKIEAMAEDDRIH